MLITFEGIDGSGKSTQISLLESRLRSEGYKVLRLREPGGTQVSERIRDLLLDAELDISPFAELMLFSAARAQLVSERISPALDSGMIVLCDRFFDSTTAYQGAGRQVADPEWIQTLNMHAVNGIVPDRTYLLEVPIDEAHRRMGSSPRDRMEQEDEGFKKRVVACYADLVGRYSQRFYLLDGTEDPDEIHRRVWTDLKRRLP